MFKKLLILLLALTLCLSAVPFVAFADKSTDDGGMTVVVDEDFESCKTDAGILATAMSGFFAYEANSIGDGYIKVQEAADGEKYLQSHVFTQVHNEIPIVGAYEFSLDVLAVGEAFPSAAYSSAPSRPPLPSMRRTVIPIPPPVSRGFCSIPARMPWA